MPSLKSNPGLPELPQNGDGNGKGRGAYWRSLEQLSQTDEFKTWLQREFPEGASRLENPVSRRSFLTVMGASMALAGLAGCRRPTESIVPYVSMPEHRVIGEPEQYATAMQLGASAVGLVVEASDGRPTKVEGNSLHPASLGGTDVWAQASVLNLYDPDRSRLNLENHGERSWAQVIDAWRERDAVHRQDRGRGLAVVAEATTSPSMARLRESFLRRYPRAEWVHYEPLGEENRDRGLAAAFGAELEPVHAFEKAKVILSLDMDFMQTEPYAVLHARSFADGRRVRKPEDDMNRLYMVESLHSTTGSMADHRFRVPAGRIPAFAAAVALELEKHGLSVPGSDALAEAAVHEFDPKVIEAVAVDLLEHRGEGLVVAGRRQGAPVHALAAAINDALGNTGRTVSWRDVASAGRSDRQKLEALAKRMHAGEVETLVVIGGNPAYNAPADLEFASALGKVEHSFHLSDYEDETSRACRWHLSRAHYLESWGDVRTINGMVSVVQPLIEPLFDNSHSDIELAHLLATGKDVRGYEIVRGTWMGTLVQDERDWRRTLHDGVLVGSEMPTPARRISARGVSALWRREATLAPAPALDEPEVVFAASPSLYDGRWANNAWLQEMPDPVTKNVWDNAALMSRATAEALGVEAGDGVLLEAGGVRVELPATIVPGYADGSITLELGYGHADLGRVADGAGVNVYPLRDLAGFDVRRDVTVRPSGRRHNLANTQDHWAMEGREIIREATLATYREHPNFANEMVHVPDLQSLWDEHTYQEGYQWGMVVDLNVCTGCNACVIACQSENNIPSVGRERVREGREMHWMRLDRYFVGDVDDARMVNQPMMCQHCEMAPCEQVCPVNATVHDQEGLNLMTYNRCIGTRYCSNNCPYKVRRFNFFNYSDDIPDLVELAKNPEVTVRSRGVMEKCTFCLQRINRAKSVARDEGRDVRDGDFQTACQQACPTNAISFGNINDPKSEVAALKRNKLNYGVLEEFNTRPRTTYMARLHNPNPVLGDPAFDTEYVPHGAGHGGAEQQGSTGGH